MGCVYAASSDISALCSTVPCNHALVFQTMTSESVHFYSTGLPGNAAIRDLSKCIIYIEQHEVKLLQTQFSQFLVQCFVS